MRMSSRAWLILFCLSLPAAAQQGEAAAPPQVQARPLTPPSPENAGAQTSRVIDLTAVVTGKSGKPVPGLQQQDFTVLDNKHPAKILSFHAESGEALNTDPAAAVEIILVMDEVNTMFERVAYERDGVKRFLALNGGKLSRPVSLAFFSDTGMQVQTHPSLDGNGIIASLDQHEHALRSITRGQGFYGAEDRLQLSLNALTLLAEQQQNRPGRKVVIWISPGWPLLTGPRINLSSKQEEGIFGSVVHMSNALRQARITLYSIDPLGLADAGGLRTTYYQEFLKGLTAPKDADMADLALQVLATQSGGLVLYGNNNIQDSITRCTDDLNAFYVLSIETPPADRPNEYHALQLKVGTPGLTVRTRTGYYSQPEAGPPPAR
jgi:VWFA-related protein